LLDLRWPALPFNQIQTHPKHMNRPDFGRRRTGRVLRAKPFAVRNLALLQPDGKAGRSLGREVWGVTQPTCETKTRLPMPWP
ncbi:MAG TPA: hypothetical protein PK170_03450, partial [Anaerolineae bacterium]|nr:hypothetical protein [Anaerolineae bacterium]